MILVVDVGNTNITFGIYDRFLHSGFNVLLRDDGRTVEETLKIAEKLLRL